MTTQLTAVSSGWRAMTGAVAVVLAFGLTNAHAQTPVPTPTFTPTPDPCPSAHCWNCSAFCDCADARPGACIGYCASGVCLNSGGACQCQEVPTVTPTPVATCTPPPTPTAPTPTPVDLDAGIRCQRTIAKETSKFVKVKMKALQKCHDSLFKDTLGPDPGPGGGRLWFCLGDADTSSKIASARTKFFDKIDKRCGGANHVCDGGAGEEATAALGFYADCSGLEGPACGFFPISDCGDIAACVECISELAVDQGMLLYYDAMIDTDPRAQKDLNKCQRAIGKETTKFLLAKEKALWKCWDKRLRGKHSDPCPSAFAAPDSPAGVAYRQIMKAEGKKIEKICKRCGGPDKQCDNTITLLDGISTISGSGGSDDLPLADIGFPASCPDVTVPGGKACGSVGGGSVTTLAHLVECVDCVSEFKVDCIDAARAPEFQVYPCECR